MLRKLRLKLTLFYLLAGSVLVALVAGGTYVLLFYYFQNETDLSLKYRMAEAILTTGAPLPGDLYQAFQKWQAARPAGEGKVSEEEGESSEQEGAIFPSLTGEKGDSLDEEAYEAGLSAIFFFPLDVDGQLMFDPNPATAPMAPDAQAVESARKQGSDLRTTILGSGVAVRLLTYRIEQPVEGGYAFIQVGRSLAEQQRVLSQLLTSLFILGGIVLAVMGAGSWWLAGRTIAPAQHAWEQQQAFVANASHELRTPLTLIRAGTEFVLRKTEAIPQSQILEDVLKECDYMNRLVEDLLLLSRLDNSRLKLERQQIAIEELLADLQRQIEKVAAAQGVNVESQATPCQIVADPIRLRQVILILVENALRAMPAGGVLKLRAECRRQGVEICVEDNGVGIASEHLAHIFDRFYKVDHGDESKKGSGLGLSIARALVEAQHGNIRIESQPGKGTRVTIVFQI